MAAIAIATSTHGRHFAWRTLFGLLLLACVVAFGDWFVSTTGAPSVLSQPRIAQSLATKPAVMSGAVVPLAATSADNVEAVLLDRQPTVVGMEPATRSPTSTTQLPSTLALTVAVATTTVAPPMTTTTPAGAYTIVRYKKGRECSEQAINFGHIKTQERCDALTAVTPECGAHFMFSETHPDWACRCCAQDGQDYGPVTPIWDVYAVQGSLPANRLPGAPVMAPSLGLPPPDPAAKWKAKYGFYIHAFADPAAVIHQVRELNKFFVDSPVYIMSDGGMDFGELCRREKCIFRLCPPANDRWHPWPFLRRMYDAALALNTEYVIMLEPDNTVHGQITRAPTHAAGGLYVSGRAFGCREAVERLAQERVPGFKWVEKSMRAGLAGGAYFRADAIFDAFSDENVMKIDWNAVADQCSKEIYSSDFAMQYALAARGWPVHAWHDCAQMDKDKDNPLTGPKDSAFRHYCSCYPGGKPTYRLQVKDEDRSLYKPAPDKYRNLNAVCQVCYNHTRYVELWGSDECTNSHPVTYSDTLLKRHHPEMTDGSCPGDLRWFCTR